MVILWVNSGSLHNVVLHTVISARRDREMNLISTSSWVLCTHSLLRSTYDRYSINVSKYLGMPLGMSLEGTEGDFVLEVTAVVGTKDPLQILVQ